MIVCTMDTSILHALNAFFLHHDDVEDPVVAYVNAAELLFLGMLVGAFVLVGGHRRYDARRAAVAAGISAAVALAIASVLSGIVDRPRPFVADPGTVHLFANHAADPGFPSDHATAAFAIAVSLLLRKRAWGAIVLVFAAILAVGRVAMGIHYPSDVAGGAALGSLTAVALWWAPVRARLHRLADFAGALLDGAVGALRRPA
jgi:undecaprenyl-diphosphatase